MKTGKPIKVVNLNSSFSNEHGLFHPHGIQFEDGSGGVFNVKDGFEPKFKVGIEAGYESTPNGNHPNKIKYMDMDYEQNKATSNGQGGGQARNTDSIIWQSCFKAVCCYGAGRNETAIDDLLLWTDEAYSHCKALTEMHTVDATYTLTLGNVGSELKEIAKEEDDNLPF